MTYLSGMVGLPTFRIQDNAFVTDKALVYENLPVRFWYALGSLYFQNSALPNIGLCLEAGRNAGQFPHVYDALWLKSALQSPNIRSAAMWNIACSPVEIQVRNRIQLRGSQHSLISGCGPRRGF